MKQNTDSDINHKAMVAVCDILGFGSLIENTPFKEIIDYHVPHFYNLLRSSIPGYDSGIKIPPSHKDIFKDYRVGSAVFSDTVLIYSLADDKYGYENLIYVVMRLLAIPIEYPNLRFRAGISYGDFYHDSAKNIYVGKALIEAYKLEKSQTWCGGALTKAAMNKIEESNCDKTFITPYEVPLESDNKEAHYVINWTLAKHAVIDKKYGWLDRNCKRPITKKEKEIEQKLKNTEKFHFKKCVQCRAARRNTSKSRLG